MNAVAAVLPTFQATATAGEAQGRVFERVYVDIKGEESPFRLSTSEDWVIAETSSNRLPTQITVVCNPAGLRPGIHSAFVTIRRADDGVRLAYIRVSFNVLPILFLTQLQISKVESTSIVITNLAKKSAAVTVRFSQASSGGASPWSFPFEGRAAASTATLAVRPLGTIELRGVLSNGVQRGWAALSSDQPIVCRAISRRSSVASSTTNESHYPALVPRNSPVYLPLDNGGTNTTEILVINPLMDATTASIDVFDEDGLLMAQSERFVIGGKQSRVLPKAQYSSRQFTNRAGRGLAVLTTQDFAPIIAASVMRSTQLTTLVPAAVPIYASDQLNGVIPVLGSSSGEIRLLNASTRDEIGLLKTWVGSDCQLGSALCEKTLGVHLPRESVLVTPFDVGRSMKWMELAIANGRAASSLLRSPSQGVGEFVELARPAVANRLVWPAIHGASSLSIVNPSAETIQVAIRVRRNWGAPIELKRINLPPGGTTIPLECPQRPVAIEPGWLIELASTDGFPILASIRSEGDRNGITPGTAW